MAWLDLNELPSLVGRRGLISGSLPARRAFLRSDHLYDPARPLVEEVRDIILQETGRTSCGPIRLLTQLRYWGFYMSPLNLFYVYDARGRRVDFVVAEVNNTPWNERHCYLLWDGNRVTAGKPLRFLHDKEFHVSPFMGMDMEYLWQLNEPGEILKAQLTNLGDSRPLFEAAMSLERRDLNPRQLRRMTLRYPLMTAQISAAIYYQAWKLWWKKCPSYTHPKKLTDTSSSAPLPPTALPRSRATPTPVN